MATAEDQKGPRDALKTTGELFRYSSWVHIGGGAEDCEEAETGTCADPLHFHAWCRLPNQLQHADIRERALASKARRIRQLKDPESDAHVVLEGDMAELRELGDVDAMVDELVNKDWWRRRLDAMTEVEDLDEFKTIDRDREHMAELRELGVDERPRDEYEELERHFGRYNDLVEEKIKAAELPLRETTAALGRDELVAQIRRERISTESTQAFMDTFSRWEWLCGTFTCRDVQTRRLVWTDPAQLSDVAPEVLDAVRGAFAELEADLQRGPKGN
jgi:hypothetical protein